MRTTRLLSALLPLSLAGAPLVARAQLGAALPGTWRLTGGWLDNIATTTVRLDPPLFGTGTTVNLEQDLGFASHTGSVVAALSWHYAPKHRLELSYNNVDRTSIKDIDRELILGNQTYAVHSRIGSRFATTFVTLGYQYALYRREGFEFGPTVAIPVVFATVAAGVELPTGTAQKQQKDWTVPPPLPGLYLSARLHQKFFVQGTATYLKATLFGLRVNMSDYGASAVWLPTRHVGGGLAWSGIQSSITREKTRAVLEQFTYRVNGPSLFITLTP